MDQGAVCAACGKEFIPPPRSKRKTCSRSCAVVLAWRDPEAAARRTASIRRERGTPEARERQTRINNEQWSGERGEGRRRALSARNRDIWADPVKKEKISAAIREANRRPEIRAHHIQARWRAWRDPEVRARMLAGMRLHHGQPEVRKRFGELLRERWQNPKTRPKLLAAVQRNAQKTKGIARPNRKKRLPARAVVLMPAPPLRLHVTMAEFQKERREATQRMRHRSALARKHPRASDEELRRAIEKSSVPIKRYPMGAPRDWKPSWMK